MFVKLTAGADMTEEDYDPDFVHAFYADFINGSHTMTPRELFEQERYVTDQAIDWCQEQFGPKFGRWMVYEWIIRFREENDAFAFRMRWC